MRHTYAQFLRTARGCSPTHTYDILAGKEHRRTIVLNSHKTVYGHVNPDPLALTRLNRLTLESHQLG